MPDDVRRPAPLVAPEEAAATLEEIQRITENIRGEARAAYKAAFNATGVAKYKQKDIEAFVDGQLEKLDEANIRLIYGDGTPEEVT